MRFMILVKATRDSEAGLLPGDELISRMAEFHEELARAGALLDASGLWPSSEGWRIVHSGQERPAMTCGPFAETKMLIAGYTIIEVASREEAIEWSRRFPNPAMDGGEAEIEVRRLYELDDFGPGQGVERFRRLDLGSAKP